MTYSPGLDEIVGTGGAVEAIYPYDYLVLATGARLVPSDLDGLSESDGGWHHFYSAEGAIRLRSALHRFERSDRRCHWWYPLPLVMPRISQYPRVDQPLTSRQKW